jgi:tRNA-dihydrouridine synthase A
MLPYSADHIQRGGRLSNVTRHVLGLYHGQPRGRAFRRYLSEHATRADARSSVLNEAIVIAENGFSADRRRGAA